MVVPWTRWLSISSSRACSTRPSRMDTSPTPARMAWIQPRHLGHHASGNEPGVDQLSARFTSMWGTAVLLLWLSISTPGGVGEEDQLVRPQSRRHRPGRVVGIAVEAAAVLPRGDGGDHRQEVPVQQGLKDTGLHRVMDPPGPGPGPSPQR